MVGKEIPNLHSSSCGVAVFPSKENHHATKTHVYTVEILRCKHALSAAKLSTLVVCRSSVGNIKIQEFP